MLRWPSLFAAGLAVGLPVVAQDRSGVPQAERAPEVRWRGRTVTLPIVMVGEYPFVESEIAGVKGKLMLDTGASAPLSLNDHRVPVRTAQEVGSSFFGSGQHFAIRLVPRVEGVRIGPINFPYATKVGSQDATQFEGITPDFIGWIGYHAWADYAMKLDYRRLRATFYRSGPESYLAGEKTIAMLPFEQRELPNHPIMAISLGDVDAVAAFDTGQYGTLYTDEATKARLIAQGQLVPGLNKDGDATYDLKSFAIGTRTMPAIPGIDVRTTPFAPAKAMGLTEPTILTIGYVFFTAIQDDLGFPEPAHLPCRTRRRLAAFPEWPVDHLRSGHERPAGHPGKPRAFSDRVESPDGSETRGTTKLKQFCLTQPGRNLL